MCSSVAVPGGRSRGIGVAVQRGYHMPLESMRRMRFRSLCFERTRIVPPGVMEMVGLDGEVMLIERGAYSGTITVAVYEPGAMGRRNTLADESPKRMMPRLSYAM